jgi:hypothetical protein
VVTVARVPIRLGSVLAGLFLVAGMVLVTGVADASTGAEAWTRQFGTTGTDEAYGVAVAADGSVYVAGRTSGALEGSLAGGTDAFVRKYDAAGNVVWTRQFGTTAAEIALGVAVSGDGSVYVVGQTGGVLGDSSAGSADAFVRKYDANGNVVWTRQFGTITVDIATGVAVAVDGSVFVVGNTGGVLGDSSSGSVDAFVRKYDANGNVVWTRQFGTTDEDIASGVAVAVDGSVYVAGETEGGLEGSIAGGFDAFVRKYDAAGSVVWTRQFGTAADDGASGVAVAGDGSVSVVGYTGGVLGDSSAGGFDAFVRMYDAAGNVVWTRQFGTTAGDFASGVAAADGSVYVAGHTLGDLEGDTAGSADAFVRTYDAAGNVVWTRQFGTTAADFASGVAAADGSVYVAGRTLGDLEGDSAGGADAFLRKYAAPPPTVGLVDPVTGQWHLRNSTGAVTSFFFGNPGDYPFMGDWTCDGVDTPGLYRQSDGFVYLRNSNTQGIADITFFFGNPGDVPIAGDFNADGCDTVSIYRPSNQTFYIINALGQDGGGLGAAQFSYVFGNPGDKPFTGDFNGNGVTTVGLHRESTGLVYFRNSHTQGNADNQFFFGDPGDRFVAGDWNGDSIDTPGVFRPANATFYFRFTNTQGVADTQFVWGDSHHLPVAGVFGLG